MTSRFMSLRPATLYLTLAVTTGLISAIGCGGGQFPVAPAKGKVEFNGQPVTSGTISFSPIGTGESTAVGKTAIGAVRDDGTFVLTTTAHEDGAVIGKHRVVYTPAEEQESDEVAETEPAEGSKEERAQFIEKMRQRQQQAKTPPLTIQGELILEVKDDGDNDFTIELTPYVDQES